MVADESETGSFHTIAGVFSPEMKCCPPPVYESCDIFVTGVFFCFFLLGILSRILLCCFGVLFFLLETCLVCFHVVWARILFLALVRNDRKRTP